MNIFKQFYRSLYSPKDIASFRFQGIGKTIIYLLLLTIIASLPNIYYLNKGINEAIHTFSVTMEDEVPSFTISDNILHTDNDEEPTIIEKPDLTIIVDSSGTYDHAKVSSYGNTVALLKNEFVIVTSGQAQTFAYSSFGNFTMTSEELIDFIQGMDSLSYVFIIILVVIYILFMLLYKVLQTLVLAMFGSFFARIFGKGLTYAQCWKITVYSITIPVIFFAIMDCLQTVVPNGYLLNWFISLFLVCLAIKEIQTEKPLQP
ncbi:DUF1189 domain-containing protein [Niallia circulans]|uniref:DUF1189 domain-containing protein n=1 Tax=Niallia circulans TaxID=1397 RepID=UPI0026E955C1|nr:DUF1189 domain-containing protein [Niallia circulans]